MLSNTLDWTIRFFLADLTAFASLETASFNFDPMTENGGAALAALFFCQSLIEHKVSDKKKPRLVFWAKALSVCWF